MSFSSGRRETSRFSSRDGRDRNDAKDRNDDYERRGGRGSGRDRSPMRGSDRGEYAGSRRSPGRRSPRRGDRQSPGRRSPRRSPNRRHSPRRSSPSRRSSSYRGGSFSREREQFPAGDPFRRDVPREMLENQRDMRGDSVPMPDIVSKVPSTEHRTMPPRCELIVLDIDGRQRMYAESVRLRLNDVGLIAELVVLRGDSSAGVVQGAVQDAARRQVLFACIVNEQNSVHRSLTVNILHGQQQEHRNMPLDRAVGLMMQNYDKWSNAGVDAPGQGLLGSAPGARGLPSHGGAGLLGSVPSTTAAGVMKRPDDNISNMLRMVLEGRNLVVEELDEVIGYFQEQRNLLAAARGIAPVAQPPKQADKMVPNLASQQQHEDERAALQQKILGILDSDPSLYQALNAKDPAAAAIVQGLRPQHDGVHLQGRMPGDSSHFQGIQRQGDTGRRMQVPERMSNPYGGEPSPDRPSEPPSLFPGGRPQPFSQGGSLLGDPPAHVRRGVGGPLPNQDFKILQDKVKELFPSRDVPQSGSNVPSVGYNQPAEEYCTSGAGPARDFRQPRMSAGTNEMSRPSERSTILGHSFTGGSDQTSAMERPGILGSYGGNPTRVSERPGLLGNPFEAAVPSDGRSDFRTKTEMPRGQLPGIGPMMGAMAPANFSMPPPGYVDPSAASGYGRESGMLQQRPAPGVAPSDRMPPSQRYSRFS